MLILELHLLVNSSLFVIWDSMISHESILVLEENVVLCNSDSVQHSFYLLDGLHFLHELVLRFFRVIKSLPGYIIAIVLVSCHHLS
jgi:hypothetical protein